LQAENFHSDYFIVGVKVDENLFGARNRCGRNAHIGGIGFVVEFDSVSLVA
jgi:hypothetical protein